MAPQRLDGLRQPWLDALRAADRAPRTVERYDAAARRFLKWQGAQERREPTLADLTPLALQGYRAARQRTDATSRVNTRLCALRVCAPGWCASAS